MSRLPHPHRALLLGLAVLGFMAFSAVVADGAMAKTKPCAQQVIDDWFDDGRVDKIYPLHCYTEAMKSLPPDLLIYGNAEDEIGRALAFAKQGKPDPGGAGPTPTTTVATDPTPTSTTPTTTVATSTTPTSTTRTNTTPTTTTTTESTTATDTSGPSSVPIPLLVLGGLAVVLLAAGSAGYLRRRRDGGDGPAAPPVS